MTTTEFKAAKGKEKIAMVTAYDYQMAKIIAKTEIDAVLVGDSLGMVFQGESDTLGVTVDQIIYHAKAVKKGIGKQLIVADMPFMSYNITEAQTLENAGRIIKESGAHAVKLEGGVEVASQVKRLVNIGIPVMGHIGLTPQAINVLGGFKVQGKTAEIAQKLIEDAKALAAAGCFAIVLECVPEKLATLITNTINIPTIGIGASVTCDGQILVLNDILTLDNGFSPKFVKQYASLNQLIEGALTNYQSEVKNEVFPQLDHTFTIDDSIIEKLY